MGSSVILPTPGQPTTGPDSTFKSAAIPNLVSFGFQGISPPSSLYIQRDDVLLLEAVSQSAGETVTFNVRLLLPYAQVAGQPDHPPAGVDTSKPPIGPGYIQTLQVAIPLPAALTTGFKTLVLSEGYLLSVSVQTSLSPVVGLTYARVQLNRGSTSAIPGFPFQLLAQGYVTLLAPITWPTGPFVRAVDGPGLLNIYAVPNPAAGADFTFSTNAVGRARLAGAIATLTTSAAAGNRFPSFRLTETTLGAVQYQIQDSVAVPASTVATYSLGPGTSNLRGGGSPVFVVLAIPAPFMGTRAVNVTSATQGIQAGDQWSAISIFTEEWLEIF